jgi:hypothetical protein
MCTRDWKSRLIGTILAQALLAIWAFPAAAHPHLGPGEFVQADGADIDVPGYSVPSFVHWDDDGLKDLVVGEGSGAYAGKVRVYLNAGTASEPLFSTYFYVQSHGSDLIVPGGG